MLHPTVWGGWLMTPLSVRGKCGPEIHPSEAPTRPLSPMRQCRRYGGTQPCVVARG